MPWLRVTGRPHHRRERGRTVKYVKGDTFHGSVAEERNLADRTIAVSSPDARIALPRGTRLDADAEGRSALARADAVSDERRLRAAEDARNAGGRAEGADLGEDGDRRLPGESGGEGGQNGGEGGEVDPVDSDLTVAQLRKMGEDLGVDLPAKATKAELRATLDEAISRM